MDLIDIKRTEADRKAERARWESVPAEQDDYPYGLTLHLDNETLEKMGLTEADFDAGQPVTVQIEGYISEDSIRSVNGEPRRSMTIQTRKIAVNQEKEASDIGTALYGGS